MYQYHVVVKILNLKFSGWCGVSASLLAQPTSQNYSSRGEMEEGALGMLPSTLK